MIEVDAGLLAAAGAIGLVAGFVKGAVGFALPMILISGLGSLLPGEMALAMLILPAVVFNLLQAFRDGIAEAWDSTRAFRRYILVVVVAILFSAQLVTLMPQQVMFLFLGSMVTIFAALQLAGWRLNVTPEHRGRTEIAVGAVAGGIGGISGIWGPPTVMYLSALETPKRESVRVQGVVYGLGAVTLMLAHLRSGVLNIETAPWSAAMLLPVAAGMLLGLKLQDRLDQERFRRATLVVLVVAGLNLIRRAVF